MGKAYFQPWAWYSSSCSGAGSVPRSPQGSTRNRVPGTAPVRKEAHRPRRMGNSPSLACSSSQLSSPGMSYRETGMILRTFFMRLTPFCQVQFLIPNS